MANHHQRKRLRHCPCRAVMQSPGHPAALTDRTAHTPSPTQPAALIDPSVGHRARSVLDHQQFILVDARQVHASSGPPLVQIESQRQAIPVFHTHTYTRPMRPDVAMLSKNCKKNLNEKCCLCCTHRRRHGKPSGYLYKSVQGRTEQVQNIALPCPSWSIQRIGPRVDWFHMLIKTLRPSPTPMMTMAITHATQSRSLFSALARVDPSLPPFLNPSLNPLTN